MDRSRLGGHRGSLSRSGGSVQRAPPSVSMTELNVFANQDKLRAEADDEGDDDDDDEYEVYNGEQGDGGDGGGDDEDNFMGHDESPLDDAARAAGDALEDQHFKFQDEGDDEGDDHDEQDDSRSLASSSPNGSSGQRRGSVSQRDSFGETQQMRRERVRLVAKLRRQQARLPADERKRIDSNAPLNHLRDLAMGASYESRAKSAVLFMRRLTVGFAKIVELIANKLPPAARMDLEGWAENVYLTLDQFDDMLYDIYDEYGDQVQTNPLVVFVMALGSNAVMFAMTKKLMQNPIANQMIGGLASAVRAQQNDQASRRAQPTPGQQQRSSGSSVPPTTQRPAVAPHASDVMGHSAASNPMGDLTSALSGIDIGGLLGNLDLGALLGGLGGQGAPAPQSSRPPLSDSGVPVVNEMAPPSVDTQEIMQALRQGQDVTMAAIPETTEETPEEAESKHDEVREVHFGSDAKGLPGAARLSFE